MDKETKIPVCIGIIMDGNRRWAKAQGLPSFAGHTEGYHKLKDFLHWSKEVGVQHVIAYAFSIENWKRSEEEVSFLITLIKKIFEEETETFVKEETKVIFAGDLSLFSPDMQEGMRSLEKATEQFAERTLTLAVSYGGREEIVHAANEAIKEKQTKKQTQESGESDLITKEDISKHLYTASVPDPDIIIRTSGEMRVSGFLPWQSVYSELFFTNTLWPDFSKEEFLNIVKEYSERERRLGK